MSVNCPWLRGTAFKNFLILALNCSLGLSVYFKKMQTYQGTVFFVSEPKSGGTRSASGCRVASVASGSMRSAERSEGTRFCRSERTITGASEQHSDSEQRSEPKGILVFGVGV